MTQIVIRGGRILDPSKSVDRVADVLIQDGLIRQISQQIPIPDQAQVIEAIGLVVTPGFIDIHCHLREPGFEYKETIASGTAAAARGGFTTICAMPNTDPTMDTRATIDFVSKKSQEDGLVRVLPIGSITKCSKGKQLSEMKELAQAGVIGFSDDGQPVANPNIMRQALSYSLSLGLPIINHCEVPELSDEGSMNEGWISNRLGIKGIPGSAEEIMVARDISLAELTGGRLHLAHISTAGSLELIRQAKEKHLNVTCEVTPHHLTLSDESVLGLHDTSSAFDPLTTMAYDTNAKVNPPLRSSSDVQAMVQGLGDGTIDVIATDHAPHNIVDKLCSFDEAAYGISGFETALGSLMSLVHAGNIELPLLVYKLTAAPAQFLGMEDLGSLAEGSPADLTIFNPDTEWLVDTSEFASKGKNTPLDGNTLKGQVMATIVNGHVKYKAVNFDN